MFHQIIVLGRLGQDPDLKYTASGKAVVNLSVAVSERWAGEETTVWYRATAWDKRAEVIAQYFHKGEAILLTGRPQAPSAWISGEEARASNEFTIDNFSFVGKTEGGANTAAPQRPTGAATVTETTDDLGDLLEPDEIPF